MLIDTDAIVLKQTKTMSSRRMLTLFTPKYGKISVGTGATEGGKNKTALYTRPFTYGHYEIFKGRDSYNLNSGQVKESFYKIGEDLDKYMSASYVLELTDKILPEESMQVRLYDVLLEFLRSIEARPKKHETLVICYMVKALDALGIMPVIDRCASCYNDGKEGGHGPGRFFSIEEGGIICGDCAKQILERNPNALIYDTDFGIVNILKFCQDEPFEKFEKLALDDKIAQRLKGILKKYMEYHLDIGKLKSESFEL